MRKDTRGQPPWTPLPGRTSRPLRAVIQILPCISIKQWRRSQGGGRLAQSPLCPSPTAGSQVAGPVPPRKAKGSWTGWGRGWETVSRPPPLCGERGKRVGRGPSPGPG